MLIFIFKFYIFILMRDRYQHIYFSFITINYITVGKFYSFFTWLIDDLIFEANSYGIFMLIILFVLNNFRNCRFVFHNLLFLFLKFIFKQIIALFRCLEILQRNLIFLINPTFYSLEDFEYEILILNKVYFLN